MKPQLTAHDIFHRLIRESALIVVLASVTANATELPVGNHPPAIELAHFPTRTHAVVWRNWQCIPTQQIADVIGATDQQVQAMAHDMGLPPVDRISPRMRQRAYITLIRRNWHLLPYDQLLALLDMTADELDFILREDDFLFVKLGHLKPQCDPVRYRPPDEATRQRVARIRATVRRHFGQATTIEPRFQFVDDLSSQPARLTSSFKVSNDAPRYIYSYFGVFGDPLSDKELDPYPDGLLARLAQRGVNGVWLHVVLRDLAPGGNTFPEFGKGHQRRLKNLRLLVDRAKVHGIRVYLYLNEPRAQRPEFFAQRNEMRGVEERGYVAMCTSHDKVRDWVRDALTHVFRTVPDLGGAFTITASENLTNCASHGAHKQCQQCKHRSYADIIGEINTAITEGVHRGNPDAHILTWDWGWNGHGDAPDVIRASPEGTWHLSVSEWAKPIERGGVRSTVGEYSISAVGPGPRAQRHWTLAQERGLKTAAKVQINNSNELLALPFLPVLDLVAEHASNLAKQNVDGIMLSWSFGGYPSPNLEVANKLLTDRSADVDAVLDKTAASRYGTLAVQDVRRAWTAFSTAYREFPYHIQVLYNGPQHMGPANLLYAEKTNYSSTMVGLPYDDLDNWRGPYPQETLASQFRKVADGWQSGLNHLARAELVAQGRLKQNAAGDLRLATAAQLHFASAANQCQYVMLRDALANENPTDSQRLHMRNLLDDEIRVAVALWNLARIDSRIGFEASNHYFYLPLDLVEKAINCEYLRDSSELR